METTEKLYETLKITFTESIQSINRMFDDDEVNWGVTTLKGWVDSYESSRFTQIGERSVIITSEYNMQYVRAWLMTHTPIETIESLDE